MKYNQPIPWKPLPVDKGVDGTVYIFAADWDVPERRRGLAWQRAQAVEGWWCSVEEFKECLPEPPMPEITQPKWSSGCRLCAADEIYWIESTSKYFTAGTMQGPACNEQRAAINAWNELVK